MYSLKAIAENLGADSVAIMVPHKSDPYLYCEDGYNIPTEWASIINPIDGSTANGKVFLSGKPSLSEHSNNNFVGHFISSIIIVPILKDSKIIGTLEVIITNKSKSFKTDALKTAQVFASLISKDL